MSGQLSPDGNYYWDGTRWASAVTPDGAWRWTGRAWQPTAARKSSRMTSRTAGLIAAGIVVALLVVGAGIFLLSRAVLVEQSRFQAQFGVACAGPSDAPGSALQSGDSVCGYKLGPAQIVAVCEPGGLPDGLRGWQQGANDAQASAADISADDSGCDLKTPQTASVWVDTANSFSPDVVVVADYIPNAATGSIGMQLACSEEGCVDIAIGAGGAYSLDEYRGQNSWKNLARGPVPLFTNVIRLNQLNRLMLRYSGGAVQVFFNGYSVARARTGVPQSGGKVSFYLDDRHGTGPQEVHLRTLDVFASA